MSWLRIRNRRGQYTPLAAMVTFSGVMLSIAAANIYKVTKAKLEVQNLAEATALAVASLQARQINVIVDRDEWLNHMYDTDDPNRRCQRFPGISAAAGSDPSYNGCRMQWSSKSDAKGPTVQSYAQLIASINKAQWMFNDAYNRFLGAGESSNGTAANSAGSSALQDILAEIVGLADPRVTVFIYNVDKGQTQFRPSFGGSVNLVNGLVPIKIETVEVKVQTQGNGMKSLTQAAGGQGKVGWLRPVWDDPGASLRVITENGKEERAIGAGVTVVKQISLPLPFKRETAVVGNAVAYVVKSSGHSVDSVGPTALSGASDAKPPAHFRPTYYVKLGKVPS